MASAQATALHLQSMALGVLVAGQGPGAPRPLGADRGGGRPAALAALLAEAPQCVPFALRVEVFRALVAAERARGRWGFPPADGGAPPLQVLPMPPSSCDHM